MSDGQSIQSVAELGIHLMYLREQQAELHEQCAKLLANMATHEDIKTIHQTIATLATRAELDQKVTALREEVERIKPATLWKQTIAVVVGLLAIAAFIGLMASLIRAIDRYQPPVISVEQAPKKP